jgi:hypothetical protein
MRAHLELLSREVSTLSRAMWTRFRCRRDKFRASTTDVKYTRVDRFLDEESLRLVDRDHDARFNLSTVFLQIDTTEDRAQSHLGLGTFDRSSPCQGFCERSRSAFGRSL